MLILVRHGMTDLNEVGRVQGVTDRPLSARGERQARRLVTGWLLPQRLRLDRIFTSPALRAVGTAEIIGDTVGQPVVAVAGLHERDFGPYEALNRAELLTLRNLPATTSSDAIEQWDDVDGVESDAAVLHRVVPALNQLGLPQAALDGDILIVTHAGVIEVLLAHFLPLPPTRSKWLKIPPASSVGLRFSDGDTRIVHLWPNPESAP